MFDNISAVYFNLTFYSITHVGIIELGRIGGFYESLSKDRKLCPISSNASYTLSANTVFVIIKAQLDIDDLQYIYISVAKRVN